MAKFPRNPKLTKSQTQELIVDLCEAIALTGSSNEAAELLTDLLGKQELEMIAKRLRIAELLLEERTYEEIREALKTSGSTIARVQVWLQQSGEGYRKIIERTKGKRKRRKENETPPNVSGIKKKYPMYFWPQILLEYWIKNATQKEKKEMQNILSKLDTKSNMYEELMKLLNNKKVS